jgi:hypothetical protein
MSMPSSPPGWYADPTGGHQLRYFDGTSWTDHVSDDGVQSTAPVIPVTPTQPTQAAQATAAPPPKRRGGKLKWIVGVIGVVVLLFIGAVAVQVVKDEKDKKEAGGVFVDAGQSFCEDFQGTWGTVMGGMITAEVLIDGLDLNPNYTGASTDDINSVTQAAQDASVIAAEAPNDIKDQISAMSQFLLLGVQLAQGDTSVVGEMQSLNISSEDAAALSGQVPFGRCSGS